MRWGRGAILVVLSSGMTQSLGAAGYDPLRVEAGFEAKTVEMTVHDDARKRDIPLKVYLPREASGYVRLPRDTSPRGGPDTSPAKAGPAPVVIFSHGLGGTRNGNVYCGKHWAARGYVAVFTQHQGSDDAVWRNQPPDQRMQTMRKAVSLENFKDRALDIPAVLDTLAKWNRDPNSPLARRVGDFHTLQSVELNLDKVGMSGHSFGAVTTQAVSGEKFPIVGTKLTDPRIKAAIAMSPSAPRRGNAESAFGSVKVPWLLMTGTRDSGPIGQADLKSRLAVYPALRGAPKYEVVLHNAEHSAFTDRALPGDRAPRNPNHHCVILALSTAFWDAYLKDDAEALKWLNGSGPRSMMEANDRWQLSAR